MDKARYLVEAHVVEGRSVDDDLDAYGGVFVITLVSHNC